jgi:protein-S-isoprenylcysteine O-methyltransferase Ste14
MAEARPVDAGRVVVVVMFSLSLASSAGRTWIVATGGGPGAGTVLEAGCGVATSVFCALVVLAYLRRPVAAATDRSVAVWIAAPLATCLPLLIPALPTLLALPARPAGAARSAAAFGLILTGTAGAVWAVRHLSSCLSVVPQARGLVDSGPYRFVRHPLYLAELVAVTGFAVRGWHWSHAVVVLALLVLQLYRAGHEEALLAATVPGYPEYARRTWRIVPGLV